MLKHWEDWSGMAHVFCGVCTGPHSTTELHRFYCCVTMALLKEPKDKLTLPYEPFAESGIHRQHPLTCIVICFWTYRLVCNGDLLQIACVLQQMGGFSHCPFVSMSASPIRRYGENRPGENRSLADF